MLNCKILPSGAATSHGGIIREELFQLEKRVHEATQFLQTCQQMLLSNLSPPLAAHAKLAHNKWMNLALAEELRQHCINYYVHLIGSPVTALCVEDREVIHYAITFQCSAYQRHLVEAPITDDEIKCAFFEFLRNKSPEPDGYTGEFFQETWTVIGAENVEVVHEFFTSGKLLKQLNATTISLIPKKQGANKIGEFRPISCCNVLYKVISKIISRRLQPLLSDMISSTQSAFVKGRLLVENVLLATKMAQGSGRGNVFPRGLLKVDLWKAFDCVNWEFMLQCLQESNLPRKLINWVEQCITSTSFSLNINESLCCYFKGTK